MKKKEKNKMKNNDLSRIGERIDQMTTLQQEFDLSFKLLRRGLGELQEIDYANDFYFLPLLLLSQGIERFLKSYIIAYKMEDEENELFDGKLKIHDLIDLLNIVKENFFLAGNREVDIQDEQFLSESVHLKRVLTILSDFGKNGRYYNINRLIEPQSVSPILEWEKLERELGCLTDEEWFKPKEVEEVNKYYQKVTSEIIIIIERFLSILSRQYIFGKKSNVFLGATMSNFSFFECMYEGDYGKTDYTIEPKEYGSDYVPHKRKFIDKLKSLLFYKQKKVSRKQYGGNWPFKSESVILESRYGRYYIVIIEEYEYALNGKTSNWLKLPTPNKAGVAISFRATDKFLKMAQEL